MKYYSNIIDCSILDYTLRANIQHKATLERHFVCRAEICAREMSSYRACAEISIVEIAFGSKMTLGERSAPPLFQDVSTFVNGVDYGYERLNIDLEHTSVKFKNGTKVLETKVGAIVFTF